MREKLQVESDVDKVPFQRLDPIAENYRRAPDKDEFMNSMKKNGININGENITPIDFFATSQDLSDEEILEAIEGYLGVENIENKIELANDSLERAKSYLHEYLHIELPKEIQNLKGIKDKSDILKIFKKTAVVKKGERIGLSPHYCALTSVFVAVFEFKKEELEGLVRESEYVYEEMLKLDEYSEVHNFHKLKHSTKGYDRVLIYDDQAGETTQAESYFRGKNECSFVSKLLNKPESNAKEAAKDGIGLKFELNDRDDIKNLIPFLAKYFIEKFGARDLVFEDTNLFDEDEMAKLSDDIESSLSGEKLTVKENKNPHTNKGFQSFKINGEINVPKDGDEDGMIMPRQFEIQIVLTDNKNESGFANHNVYEASKKLAIVTRLLGAVTKKHLDIFSAEAGEKAGLSADSIREYLKDTFLVEINTKKSRKKRYAHEKTLDRLMRAGVIKDIQKLGKKEDKSK
jgi:hypothetical protein